MHPKDLSIQDFTYDLPADRIAYHPLERRDSSQLLVYQNGHISTDIYRNIAHHLPHNAFMVFNDTRVVEARLLFKKPTGGLIEIFCLEPADIYPDITVGMSQVQEVQWVCLVGGAAKWKKDTTLLLPFTIDDKNHLLEARLLEKKADSFLIAFSWEPAISFAELLHHTGHVPLPPYIKRTDDNMDKNRYQTIFAEHDGSVAAPTAGLHFTDEVLSSIQQKQINTGFVTLHVGAGTFKPVKAASMEEHIMHSEFIEVNKTLIEQLKNRAPGPLIAVGTTSMRTLESLYWLGAALTDQPDIFDHQMPEVTQWEPYEKSNHSATSATQALQAVLDYLQNNNSHQLIAKTKIIIAPGYSFKMVSGLITNFHQPASTLLLLVAAFIGPGWKNAYSYALENNFRFLSYGDGCLLWHQPILS